MNKGKMIVGIAGSGSMGSGIAQVAAGKGHQVMLFDSSKPALDRAKKTLAATLNQLLEKQKINQEESAEISDNIIYTESLKGLSNCGIIIEAIVEKLEVKQQLFRELEKTITNDCIFATNTSSLSITAIAGACANPSNVIGIHFFNPAPIMPLVEIVPGIVTDEAVIKTSKTMIDSWGKITVIAKDTPGFIVNRIARPFYGEAIRIYEEQIADFCTIDHAMKEVGGFRMGPFELMDFIGNDVNYAVTEAVWQQMFFDPRYKPSLTQKRLNEAGQLGRKTGSGYYNYSKNGIVPPMNNNIEKHQYIYNRILCMLINEAIDAVYHGIATKEDIDIAMTKGVNYPKGLLRWADELGLKNVLQTLESLQQEYAEERYRPSILLRKMAQKNLKFYYA